MQLVDFNAAKRLNRFYGGAAGRKVAIEYQGIPWMLKYPETTAGMRGNLASYTTSPVSEWLGSHVYELVGIPVHETVLGFSEGKVVCACKDFTWPDKELIEFRMLKNSLSDDGSAGFSQRPSDGRVLLLSDVLTSLDSLGSVYSSQALRERFWDMFIVDAFIGNKDRNNGNWGLLSKSGEILGLAPVYDNGNSFFNKRKASTNELRSQDANLLEQDAVGTCVSVYTKDDGRYVKPFEYIASAMDAECNKALDRFMRKLDMDAVVALVDQLPCEVLNFSVLDKRTKEFTKKVLVERYEKALLPAWDAAKGCLRN